MRRAYSLFLSFGILFFLFAPSLHADGQPWEKQSSPQETTLTSVAVVAENRAYAVGGQGTILVWDGSTWTTMTSGTMEDLWDIAAVGDQNLWAVGDRGTVRRWNGSSWNAVSPAPPTTEHLLGIAVRSSQEIWVVGEGGVILKWNGSAWQNFTDPEAVAAIFYSVRVLPGGGGWIVGSGGRILRWNGTQWQRSTSGVAHSLFDVASSDANHAFAVGESGMILSWNGSSWRQVTSPTAETLLGVTQTSSTAAIIVGENRTMITTADSGSTWSALENPEIAPHALFRISESHEIAFTVGTGGVILYRPAVPPVPLPPPPGTPPSPLTLIDPEDGGRRATTQPFFQWNTSSGATTYTLQITGRDAQSGVTRTIVTTETAKQLSSGDALPQGTFSWQVRAENSDGTQFSNTHLLTIDTVPPPQPTLIEPNEGAAVSQTPRFSWNAVVDPTTPVVYRLEVDDEGTFSPPRVFERDGQETFVTLPAALPSGKRYFWRVAARDGLQNTSAFVTRSFTVPSPPPPPPPPDPPTLLAPLSNALLSTTRPTFSWNTVPQATAYILEIDDASQRFGNDQTIDVAMSGSSSTVSLPQHLALADGGYVWRVRGENSSGRGAPSEERNFIVDGTAPPAPTLLSPENGSEVPPTPTFQWSSVVDPSTPLTYRLEIDTQESFLPPLVVDRSATTPAVLSLQDALTIGTTYWWRVRVVDAAGNPRVSAARRFTVIAPLAPPGEVRLLTPGNGQVTNDTPEFSWSTVEGATQYEFEIEETLARTLTLIRFTPDRGVLPEATLAWRVRARNAHGAGPWSERRTFTVDRMPPEVPILLGPQDKTSTTSGTPQFLWSAPLGAVRYDFSVVNGLEALGLTVTSFTPSPALPVGTYSWRVRAYDAVGNAGAWTAVRSLTIAPPPSEEPEPTPSPTPTPEQTPTLEPTLTPTPTPEPSPTPAPTPTPQPTPVSKEKPVSPTLQLTPPVVFATNRPLLVGTITPLAREGTVEIDGQILTTIALDAQGQFRFDTPIRLPQGTHTLRILFGQLASMPVSFTIDTTPPSSPTTQVSVVRQTVTETGGSANVELVIRVTASEETVRLRVVDPGTGETILAQPVLSGETTVTVTREAEIPGTHRLILGVEDAVGNTRAVEVTYDVSLSPITYSCNDGQDNDSDGRIDFPDDPGCAALTDTSEDDPLHVILRQKPVVRDVATAVTTATHAVQKTTRNIAEQTAVVTRDIAKKTVEQTAAVAEATERIVEAVEPVAVPALATVVPVTIAVNPVTAASIPQIPVMATHAFSWLFSALGLKRRRKNPWGVVYDAITKDPIGLAIVRLHDVAAQRLVGTQVTDKMGRFEFLVRPGTYSLEVVKTPYTFPSTLLSGLPEDEYGILYHGGAVTIHTEGEAVHVNIPLDPEAPEVVRRWSLKTIRRVVGRASLPLLVLGTAVSVILYAFSQTRYNLMILLVYIVIAAYEVFIISGTRKKSRHG